MENYKRLNAEMALQMQEMRQHMSMYELRVSELTSELISKEGIIQQQKRTIEGFVSNNSVDLNDLLGNFVDGHNANMTVITDFIQKMLTKLQNLLMNVVAEVGGDKGRTPSPAALATQRVRRSHRSLSPVITRTAEETDEDVAAPNEIIPEIFVTKRRRMVAAFRDEDDLEVKQPVETVLPCVPVTLPNGLLSTILEDDSHNSIANESVREENTHLAAEPENRSIAQPPHIVIHDDVENIIPADMPDVFCRTPAKKKNSRGRKPAPKQIESRNVLSPVNPNVVLPHRNTPARGAKRQNGNEELPERESCMEEVRLSGRPKRNAAPTTLSEPSLRTKIRRQ